MFALGSFNARHEDGDEFIAFLDDLCHLVRITQWFAFNDSEPDQ